MCLFSLGKQGQGNQCQTLEVIFEEKDGKKQEKREEIGRIKKVSKKYPKNILKKS